MSFCELYFSNPITNITIDHIQKFFKEEKSETDTLEFKSIYNGISISNQIEKLCKTITGMLNSQGGLIIVGSPAKQKLTTGKEVFKGELTFSENPVNKDWLVNKITDSITPNPSNIKVNPIECSRGTIYIIEIEKSLYSPHQYEYTYYMRIDGQTKPAPHHYVEALMKKISFPLLQGYVYLHKYSITQEYYHIGIWYELHNLSRFQNEENYWYQLIITPGVFSSQHNYQITYHNPAYYLSGSEINVQTVDSLIFSRPFHKIDHILIPKKIAEQLTDLNILFAFAGKTAPLKTCSYKIDLKKMIISMEQRIDIDLNDFIIAKEENKYAFEKADGINNNDEERIKESSRQMRKLGL
jgi:hypothetical protein